jgi:hypothetical protein
MPRKCARWRTTVLATENSKSPTHRPSVGFSSHSLALSPPCRANVPLAMSHFVLVPFRQSSHRAIGISPNLKKTIIEKSFNRHTFTLFHSADHRPPLDFYRPRRTGRGPVPFWYSSHPGGGIPPNPMKTFIEKLSSRHTLDKGDDTRTLKVILDRTKIVDHNTPELKNC